VKRGAARVVDRIEAKSLLAVARLARPHGIRGELSSIVLAPLVLDAAELLLAERPLWLRAPDGQARPTRVEAVRPHQDRWLIKLKGVDSMTDAEPFRDLDLCLAREDLPPLPDGWFWEADIENSRVLDARLGELGRAESLDVSGQCPQLLVRRPTGAVARIPWVKAYLRGVDLDAHEIHLDLPDGFPGISDAGE
jgi:16S rRNA processing protein RimM